MNVLVKVSAVCLNFLLLLHNNKTRRKNLARTPSRNTSTETTRHSRGRDPWCGIDPLEKKLQIDMTLRFLSEKNKIIGMEKYKPKEKH